MYHKIHYWHAFQRSRPLLKLSKNPSCFLCSPLEVWRGGQTSPAQFLVFKFFFCLFVCLVKKNKVYGLQWYKNNNTSHVHRSQILSGRLVWEVPRAQGLKETVHPKNKQWPWNNMDGNMQKILTNCTESSKTCSLEVHRKTELAP